MLRNARRGDFAIFRFVVTALALAVLSAQALAAENVPAANPSPFPEFVGPTPVVGAPHCSGESRANYAFLVPLGLHITDGSPDDYAQYVLPKRMDISPASRDDYRSRNGQDQGSVAFLVRLDGAIAVSIPAELKIDDALRKTIMATALQIRLTSPIKDCFRPVAILFGFFDVGNQTMSVMNAPVRLPNGATSLKDAPPTPAP